MPSLRKDEFHMTFTDSGGLTAPQVQKIKEWVVKKGTTYCAVEEHGKNGNIHVHAYVRFKKPKVASNLRKQVTTIYGQLKVDPTRLRITKVDDYKVLIGSYFTKEDDYKLIIKSPDIDMEEFKQYAIKFLQKKKIKCFRISYSTAHHTIHDWSIRTGTLIYNEGSFKQALVSMLQDGYPIQILCGKMLWIYSAYAACYLNNTVHIMDRINADFDKQLDREIREIR